MDQLIDMQTESEVLDGQIQGEENPCFDPENCAQIPQDFDDEWDNWHPHFF